MKFTAAAFLILAGVCSAAEPSTTTEDGLFKVIASSTNKAPQMMVVKGQIKSLHGTDHLEAHEDPSGLGGKRFLEEGEIEAFASGYGSPGSSGYGHGPPRSGGYGPRPGSGGYGPGHGGSGPYPPSGGGYGPPKKANDWIVEDGDGPDGSGFEVEEGQLTAFEGRRDGRGGRGRGGSEGICTKGGLCYNNVIATVKGATYKYGGEYYGKEYLKLCLVSAGSNSCWTVTCPSMKQQPYLLDDDCYNIDKYDCGCSCGCRVYDTLVNSATLKLTVRTTYYGCGRRLQEDTGTDSACSDEVTRRLDGTGDETGRELRWGSPCDGGGVATVEIVCGEPRYD